MRTLRFAALSAVAVVGLTFGGLTEAQPQSAVEKAKAHFKAGETHFDLGNWDKAVAEYKLAYEALPKAGLLYNIAQAYRQGGNCKQAVFFYRRYLANDPNTDKKPVVEKFIEEQEKACEGKEKPPNGTIKPDNGNGTGTGTTGTGTTGTGTGTTGTGTGTTGTGTGTGTTGTGTGTTGTGATGTGKVASGDDDEEDDDDDDDDIGVSTSLTYPPAKLISAHVGLGTSFVSFGDPALQTDPLLAFAAGAGYPLAFGDIGVEAGAMLTYSPVPWESTTGLSGTAGLWGLLANAGGTYPIPGLPALAVRGDVGLGVQFFSGLGEVGTPFLEASEKSDAPLTTVHVRVAAGAEFAITKNINVAVSPIVFAYSPRGKLRETISGVSRFELLVGFGYKM